MRNLRCVHQAQINIETALPCTAAGWDAANDALIFTNGPSKDSAVIQLRRIPTSAFQNGIASSATLVASWDAPCPLPDLEHDQIIDLKYCVSTETTCLVLAGGDIVIVRDVLQPGQEKIEIVGSIDAGIAAAAWTSDEDLLAITTRAGTLVFMTSDFDNTANAVFAAEDANLSRQVNVGWGKKETQFQGKGAKALRDPTMPEKVDQGILSADDDLSASMSWRGDGAYVAVNTVENHARRMIRVFSRDGVLDSVSEAVDGLEGCLSWKPSGQLIAGVQRSEADANVVFFERNGLRHGEFSLRLTGLMQEQWTKRISLSWNLDSTILAVAFVDRVQFWTVSNYHYYLKYETLLVEPEVCQSTILWHPEDSLRCFIHTLKGPASSVRSIRFSSLVVHGATTAGNDIGCVAVIDGKTLRFTPLRQANIPPPMALYEIELKENALDADISPENTRLAVLHAHSVSLYDITPSPGAPSNPQLLRSIPLSSSENANLQVKFGGNSELIVLTSSRMQGKIIINEVEKSITRYEGPCGRAALMSIAQCTKVVVALVDNNVFDINGVTNPVPITTVSVTVNSFAAYRTASSVLTFALSSSGALYANDRLLIRNCTSFMLTDTHLVTTSSNHLLKFTPIEDTEADTVEVPSDAPDADELCRSIERGARLVSVMPSAYAVVLQMPRGNLETIYPRALVLTGIRTAISERRYKQAFKACRNHRVDMNIIHDYKLEQFMSCIPLIIDQLRKVEDIDLLLSQLSEEDVTQSLYRDPKEIHAKRAEAFGGTSKVNRICNAFLSALKPRYATNLQNMITANLCKNPPDIEAGLEIILDLHTSNPDLVDDAVEHICFLADVNRIYEAALGIYHLDIALLIAQQSQKDPREYLPYLQSLQELEEGQQRFRIDDDLGRHSKAIEHLYALDDIDQVDAYATKHELHAKALRLCKYNKKYHDQLTRSYAAFLNSRNRYKEAAIAYESLHDFTSASAAYRAINMWREALSSAQLATDYSAEDLASLALALSEALEESKDFALAAQIHHDYLNDIPTSLRLHCKAHHFSEALRLAALHKQPSLLTEVIDPGLGEGFGTLSELLAECKGQLNAQVPRLRELRTKRENDPLAFLEGGPSGDAGADVPDDLSLAGSVTSTHASTLLTRYTARSGNTTLKTGASRKTSRNAKREERKRARGKKGSVYEEEYLVNSVGRLIERVNETVPDIEHTVDALCRRGMWERAEALEAAATETVGLCAACIPEVWEAAAEEAKEAQGEARDDEYRPVGGERVLWESLEAARKARTPPVVRQFTASALLAK